MTSSSQPEGEEPHRKRRTKTHRPHPRFVHSAGGVLFSDEQVVLISTSRGTRWQLPKGRIERGESPAQAARREVREETGVDGIILEPLQTIEFQYQQRNGRTVIKKVDYFLQRYSQGSVADFDPVEVNEANWFPWQQAIDQLTFDNERSVASQAFVRWRELQRGET